MNIENIQVRELSAADGERVEHLFLSVFTRDPWNDDWSDKDQLHAYMSDISGNPNSLSLGLFEADELVGISLGSVIHWFSGTEYYIREFCVSTDLQHKGYGSYFLEKIQRCLAEKSITAIILSTDKDTSAYRFYLKNGFSEMEKNVFFYKNIGSGDKE
jgi:aminoglycoside 6'-N-acetyltransferase I